MLARLRLRNFLSFREAELPLGKLNVVVGSNASGKTNLLRALELLGSLARHGYPCIEGYAGPNPIGGWLLDLGNLAHNFDASAAVTVGVSVLAEEVTITYAVRISIEGFEEEVARGREVLLRASSREHGFTYAARDGSPRTTHRPAAASIDVLRYDPRGGRRSQRVSAYPSALACLPADAHPALHALAATLRGVRVLHLDHSPLRARSSVKSPPEIGYRGGGLARQLLQLCLERRRELEEIEKTLRSLLPDLEAIVPHLEGDEVEVQMRVNGHSKPIPPAGLSDGVLRLACLVTALRSGCSLIAFEAPESFLHPKQLELLIAISRLAEPQIIFTTYSPQLLDYLQPEEVIVVTRAGAESKAERLVESEKYKIVREFLEEGGSLSEAWLTDLL